MSLSVIHTVMLGRQCNGGLCPCAMQTEGKIAAAAHRQLSIQYMIMRALDELCSWLAGRTAWWQPACASWQRLSSRPRCCCWPGAAARVLKRRRCCWHSQACCWRTSTPIGPGCGSIWRFTAARRTLQARRWKPEELATGSWCLRLHPPCCSTMSVPGVTAPLQQATKVLGEPITGCTAKDCQRPQQLSRALRHSCCTKLTFAAVVLGCVWVGACVFGACVCVRSPDGGLAYQGLAGIYLREKDWRFGMQRGSLWQQHTLRAMNCSVLSRPRHAAHHPVSSSKP